MNSDVAEAQWKAQCPKWVNRVILAERRPLRSTPISRHFQSPSACLKGAKGDITAFRSIVSWSSLNWGIAKMT